MFYFYLSEAPSMTTYPPPLTHFIRVFSILILIYTGKGGELTREVRGAIVPKAGQKYQHDWLYPQSLNSIKRHLGFVVFIGSLCRRAKAKDYPSIKRTNQSMISPLLSALCCPARHLAVGNISGQPQARANLSV